MFGLRKCVFYSTKLRSGKYITMMMMMMMMTMMMMIMIIIIIIRRNIPGNHDNGKNRKWPNWALGI
jgi:uncharacterized membrane protein